MLERHVIETCIATDNTYFSRLKFEAQPTCPCTSTSQGFSFFPSSTTHYVSDKVSGQVLFATENEIHTAHNRDSNCDDNVQSEHFSAPFIQGVPAIVARFLYEIPVTAHKLDISTPATAHHPNFSHMLVLLLGSLGVYILY